MESMSPCARPECIRLDKRECSENCHLLNSYQQYLDMMAAHTPGSAPAIDYSDLEQRYEIRNEEAA